MQPSQIQIRKEKTALYDIPRIKYHISEEDLKTKCWWCAAKVTGFDKSIGRNRAPYKNHFCNSDCHCQFHDAVKADDEEQDIQIEPKMIPEQL